MSRSNPLLFVYGTLHPNRAPAGIRHVVSRLTEIGPATLRGTLHHLGPYPGVTLPGAQIIEGTLFALPDDPTVLQALDDYEGFHPNAPEQSLFLRESHRVTHKDGTEIICWVYLYNRPIPKRG